MINTTFSTKTWNEGKQEHIKQPDNVKNLDAKGEEKALRGKENIGQVLNQIADPNWVDPTKKRRETGDSLDKDAFLKLMLTQMKNQDPLNPMDSHQMASELAQFSSLEQLQNINDNLGGMKKNQDPLTNFQTLNFIGKTVASDSTKITRAKGDKSHDIRFSLGDDTKAVTINIKDASGKVVKKMELPDLKRGDNKLSWNGYGDNAAASPAGSYTFEVAAIDKYDKKVGVKTATSGKVTGVNFTPEGPVLLIGDQSIRLSEIKKIEDPDKKMELQNSEKAIELKAPEAKNDMRDRVKPESKSPPKTEIEGAPEAAPEQSGLAELKMTPQFQAQLASAIKPKAAQP